MFQQLSGCRLLEDVDGLLSRKPFLHVQTPVLGYWTRHAGAAQFWGDVALAARRRTQSRGSMNSLPKSATSASLDELRRLERLWKLCGQCWFATHWVLLSTNLAAAVLMLAGPRIGLSPDVLLLASVYVPASTLVIATLKPSTRATTFISAYRMLYFALLKQRLSALSTEKVIAVAEQAEVMIAQGGYMPSIGDLSPPEKTPVTERK